MDQHRMTLSCSPPSPTFMKPKEVFMMRRKDNNDSSQKSRKRNLIPLSPLKCLDPNSPAKNGSIQYNHLGFRRLSPKRLSPVAKNQRKTPVKGKRNSENRNPCTSGIMGGGHPNSKSSKPSPAKIDSFFKRTDGPNGPSPKTPSSTKRQLNFFGSISPDQKHAKKSSPATVSTGLPQNIPCITIDEETNLEAPTQKKMRTHDVPHVPTGEPKLPVDWSLKTRIRFVSSRKFPYRGNFSASEDATGTSAFIRCINSSKDDSFDEGQSAQLSFLNCDMSSQSSSGIFSPTTGSSVKKSPSSIGSSPADLRKLTMVFSHPNLPWLTLYPRMGVRQSVTSSSSGSSVPTFDASSLMAKCLWQEWSKSIMSVLNMVKTRMAPFFYVCSPTFTVLIRAAGISGVDEIHALVTPTTSGFRNHLKEEKISFFSSYDMSKYDGETNQETKCFDDSSSRVSDNTSGEFNEGDPENSPLDDDDANSFLEELGLSQQTFPSLSSNRSFKTNRKTLTGADKTKERQTLVYMSGWENVKSFVNFLINNPRICVSSTGPLTSIPPTLLSPVGFEGATLTPFRIKSVQPTKINGEDFHSLEIIGPILPTNVQGLSEFLRGTQNGHFKMNLITHEPTAALTTATKTCASAVASSAPVALTASVFAAENLKDCGISVDIIPDLCSSPSGLKDPLTEVTLADNLYTF